MHALRHFCDQALRYGDLVAAVCVNVGIINSIRATDTEPANASGLLLYALGDLLCINVLHDRKRQRVAARAARVAISGCQFHGSSSPSRLIG